MFVVPALARSNTREIVGGTNTVSFWKRHIVGEKFSGIAEHRSYVDVTLSWLLML